MRKILSTEHQRAPTLRLGKRRLRLRIRDVDDDRPRAPHASPLCSRRVESDRTPEGVGVPAGVWTAARLNMPSVDDGTCPRTARSCRRAALSAIASNTGWTVGRGAGDDLQNVGGRRLLLERLGDVRMSLCEGVVLLLELREQPHVLDGDHRLVGEGRHQLDLRLGEWSHLRSPDRQCPDRYSLAQHRHGQHRSQVEHRLHGIAVLRILRDVGDVDDPTLQHGPAGRDLAPGRRGKVVRVLSTSRRREAEGRCESRGALRRIGPGCCAWRRRDAPRSGRSCRTPAGCRSGSSR